VDWKHGTLTWQKDSPTVEGNDDISGKIPRTLINFASEPANREGLALSCQRLVMPHASSICTPPIVLGDSLLGIRSLVEPVNPLQIKEVKTSLIDVHRLETPLETTTVSIPDFAMPDMHI